MTLHAAVLRDDALILDQQGPALNIGLNWYRSLPLSSVETLEVTIDGRKIAREDIRFAVNGRTRTLDDLHDLWDEEWFILDPATLRFRYPPALTVGQCVEVTVKLSTRSPYIVLGPGRTLEYLSESTRTLTVRGPACTESQTEVKP